MDRWIDARARETLARLPACLPAPYAAQRSTWIFPDTAEANHGNGQRRMQHAARPSGYLAFSKALLSVCVHLDSPAPDSQSFQWLSVCFQDVRRAADRQACVC